MAIPPSPKKTIEDTPIKPLTASLNVNFSVGESVEVNYKGEGEWYGGVIRSAVLVLDEETNMYHNLYDIDYEDGDQELGVPANRIRCDVDEKVTNDDAIVDTNDCEDSTPMKTNCVPLFKKEKSEHIASPKVEEKVEDDDLPINDVVKPRHKTNFRQLDIPASERMTEIRIKLQQQFPNSKLGQDGHLWTADTSYVNVEKADQNLEAKSHEVDSKSTVARKKKEDSVMSTQQLLDIMTEAGIRKSDASDSRLPSSDDARAQDTFTSGHRTESALHIGRWEEAQHEKEIEELNMLVTKMATMEPRKQDDKHDAVPLRNSVTNEDKNANKTANGIESTNIAHVNSRECGKSREDEEDLKEVYFDNSVANVKNDKYDNHTEAAFRMKSAVSVIPKKDRVLSSEDGALNKSREKELTIDRPAASPDSNDNYYGDDFEQGSTNKMSTSIPVASSAKSSQRDVTENYGDDFEDGSENKHVSINGDNLCSNSKVIVKSISNLSSEIYGDDFDDNSTRNTSPQKPATLKNNSVSSIDASNDDYGDDFEDSVPKNPPSNKSNDDFAKNNRNMSAVSSNNNDYVDNLHGNLANIKETLGHTESLQGINQMANGKSEMDEYGDDFEDGSTTNKEGTDIVKSVGNIISVVSGAESDYYGDEFDEVSDKNKSIEATTIEGSGIGGYRVDFEDGSANDQQHLKSASSIKDHEGDSYGEDFEDGSTSNRIGKSKKSDDEYGEDFENSDVDDDNYSHDDFDD